MYIDPNYFLTLATETTREVYVTDRIFSTMVNANICSKIFFLCEHYSALLPS